MRRKDDREPTGADYRRLLIAARKRQLTVSREGIQRLMRTYDGAASRMAGRLASLPAYMLTEGGALRQSWLAQIVSDLNRIIDRMVSDYGQQIEAGMLGLAQTAAEREDALQQLMASSAARDVRLSADQNREYRLSDGETVTVRFGRVARQSVEALAGRYYSDGLTLSERVHGQVDRPMRRTVEDTIVQGVAEQVSAKDLADRLERILTEPATGNARYNAMRIARTETNNAHREAHVRSTIDPQTGELKSFIQGIRFTLSSSHPKADICDVWASHDGDGLGAGIYLPANVPLDHPHGLCFTMTVLKEFQDVTVPARAPDPESVADAEIARYASEGDTPAQAAQSQRESAS